MQIAESTIGGGGQVCVTQLSSGGVEQWHSSQGVSESIKRSPTFKVTLPNLQIGSADVSMASVR
jgi:hypothetical protein